MMYVSHSQVCFSKGSFDFCKLNVCSHAHMFIEEMEKFLCSIKNFTFIHWFNTSKAWRQNNEVYVIRALQLVQMYIVFASDLHVFMPHSLICAFLCRLLDHYQCCILYYFLSLCSCFSLLHLLLLIVPLTHDFLHVVLCDLFHWN